MITSSSNSKIKHVCQLVTKAKARRTEQLFVVEGIRMAKEAPKELLKEVYVSTSFLQKKEQSKLLETLSVPYEEVSDDIFAKMSDTVTPQGVLCVLRQPSYDLGELLGRDGTFLVLEDIQDPGNLGTMLRTGEGAGITAVIMSKKTADLFNPKTIRSTMGSVYRVPFCLCRGSESGDRENARCRYTDLCSASAGEKQLYTGVLQCKNSVSDRE